MPLDADDIADLYARHARQLVAFFARRTYDADVAVELMAETFAAVVADRYRFRGSGDEAAAAWLYGIARHRLSDWLRHGRVERRALARLGLDPPQLSDAELERIDELAADQTSLDSSSVLTAPRSADPAGGPPWALRLTRSQTGLTCMTVGQVRGGVFGIVGEDRVFRQIPTAVVDSCGRGLLLGSRIVAAPTNRATRSIVFGVAGSATRSVALVTAAGGRRVLQLGARGTFVAALPGYPEDTAARVEITAADGRVTRRSLGARPGLVPDLAGAPAWRLLRFELGTRQYCARPGDARRPLDRFNSSTDPNGGGSSLPTTCISRRGGIAWAAQALRVRAGQRGAPGFDRWQYTGRPPRTILLGVARASDLVTRVTVTRAGAPRVLTPTANGTFALVLPASVDPRKLRLSVRLKDGTLQRGRSGHGVVADLVASRRVQ